MKHDGCKGCKYENQSASSGFCIGCIQNAVDKYKPQNNADRIRKMSDEELAEWLCHVETCPIENYCPCLRGEDEKSCLVCIFEWLQKEVDQ